MIKIVDPCVSNPNDIGYLKQSNATLRLKLFSISFISAILLTLFLCLGSQNLGKRHNLNLLMGETVKLPNGFLVGISFVLGVISGGGTAALMANINNEGNK